MGAYNDTIKSTIQFSDAINTFWVCTHCSSVEEIKIEKYYWKLKWYTLVRFLFAHLWCQFRVYFTVSPGPRQNIDFAFNNMNLIKFISSFSLHYNEKYPCSSCSLPFKPYFHLIINQENFSLMAILYPFDISIDGH